MIFDKDIQQAVQSYKDRDLLFVASIVPACMFGLASFSAIRGGCVLSPRPAEAIHNFNGRKSRHIRLSVLLGVYSMFTDWSL